MLCDDARTFKYLVCGALFIGTRRNAAVFRGTARKNCLTCNSTSGDVASA